MGDDVLGLGTHFGKADAALARDEDGVVAESSVSLAVGGDVAFYAAGPSAAGAIGASQGHDGAELGPTVDDAMHLLQQKVDVVVGETVWTGKTGGVDAGGAAEGIDRVHVFSDYRELDFGMKYGFVIDSLRLLARGVVVVDRDDVVRYVEYVPEVTHEPDYEKALAVARELAK